MQGNSYRIGLIIDRLIQDFAFSPQANYRKGGLLSLAAAAVALADQNLVSQLLNPQSAPYQRPHLLSSGCVAESLCKA